MSRRKGTDADFSVSIHSDPDDEGNLRVTFVQVRVDQQGHAAHYILSANSKELKWLTPPDDSALQKRLEETAAQRVSDREAWLNRLNDLVTTVEAWAGKLGWSSKVIEKKMEDWEIGNYRAPSLLLQQDSVRLYLEPIARCGPGHQGVVDLYLMPSYDDIASVFFYNDHWNVHYMFEGTPTVGNIRDAEGTQLTETSLQQVLGEMKAHAE